MNPTLEFIPEALVRGFVIAVVGILLYVWQTDSKTRANKRDMARILRSEVMRILNIDPVRERERIISSLDDRIPNNLIYLGLLQTGNIRFFDNELQDRLDGWYWSMDDFSFDRIDSDDGIELVKDLEHMEQKNISYRQKVRFWHRASTQ